MESLSLRLMLSQSALALALTSAFGAGSAGLAGVAWVSGLALQGSQIKVRLCDSTSKLPLFNTEHPLYHLTPAQARVSYLIQLLSFAFGAHLVPIPPLSGPFPAR